MDANSFRIQHFLSIRPGNVSTALFQTLNCVIGLLLTKFACKRTERMLGHGPFCTDRAVLNPYYHNQDQGLTPL